ncbi:MAG TPA: hypothetical protein VIV60_08425 [Polyangiaceae bacterium]
MPRDLFAQLGILPRFAIEGAELDRRQRELFVQRQAEGPRALELMNEAVNSLRDPATRAEQLFELRGWATRGSPDPILLERIFTDREFIDLARKKGDITALNAWIDAARPRQQALLSKLTLLLDGPAATAYASQSDAEPGPESSGLSRRALLILEEFRYVSRAIVTAHNAISELEALETSQQ